MARSFVAHPQRIIFFSVAAFILLAGLSVLPRTRRLKLRIRSIRQRSRHNFAIVRMIRIVAVVHATVGEKCPKNAAVIIHHQIRILPVPAQLQTRATVRNELPIEGWPVTHIEINGLPVSREVEMRPHAATEVEPKLLSTRGAEIAHPR